jgi:hypothetical protein
MRKEELPRTTYEKGNELNGIGTGSERTAWGEAYATLPNVYPVYAGVVEVWLAVHKQYDVHTWSSPVTKR